MIFSMLLAMQTAFSQTPYIKVGVGMSTLPDSKVTVKAPGVPTASAKLEYDSAHCLNAAFGVDYDNGYKLELSLSAQKNDGNFKEDKTDKVKQNNETLGLNIIREFSSGRWAPFVSAGAGFVFTDFDDDGVKVKDTSVSFNVGGGITYSLSDNYSLYGHYNYLMISDFEDSFGTQNDLGQPVNVDVELELAMHQFTLGITRSF